MALMVWCSKFQMIRWWLTLSCVLFALPMVALGQPRTIDREVRGKPATNINVGIFTSVHRDCTAAPLPVIRLVAPPSHGKVVVKQGRVRATNLRLPKLGECLGAELPAFIAIYRSSRGFTGQDLFTLEVIGAGGKAQFQRVRVIVMGPGTRRGI